MYFRISLLFFYFLTCVSCTTFNYYYPHHEFKKKIFNPVKKGLIEMGIRHESTYSKRNYSINNRKKAYKIGLQNVKSTIHKFCNGSYKINAIINKTKKIGTQSFTDYNQYNNYLNNHHGSPKIANILVNGLLASQGGQSTTITNPVFKRYTNITFQCR